MFGTFVNTTQPVNITRHEWVWTIIATSAIICATLIPFIVGYLATPNGSVFLGVNRLNYLDTQTYMAWIEQARDGHLFFKDLYNSTIQPRVIFHPIFLLLGWLARIATIPNVLAFHLGRIVLDAAFLLLAYRYIAGVFQEVTSRRLCFILLATASGIGGLIGAAASVDMYMPEANTFLSLYQSVLNIASLLLMILIFMILEGRAFRESTWRGPLLAGLLLDLLLLIHPYDFVIVALVSAVWALYSLVARNEILVLRNFLWMLVFAFPGLIYQAYALAVNSTLSEWAYFEMHLPSLWPWFYLTGFGLLGIFALYGIAYVLRMQNRRFIFILIWIFTITLLIYFPPAERFQRKLSEGMQIPIAILGTVGIVEFLKWVGQRNAVRALYVLIPLFCAVGSIGMIKADSQDFVDTPSVYYMTRDEGSAFEWLHMHTSPGDTILSGQFLGLLTPIYADRGVYLGHVDQTTDFHNKLFLLQQIIKHEDNSSRALSVLVAQQHISYILFDKEMYSWRGGMLETSAPLAVAYQNPSVIIYRIDN